jgi:RND superfamily putative drug exporter
MLTRLANLGIRAPRRVLGVAAVLLVLAAVYGISAAGHLSSGGFSDPKSPSSKAADVLDKTFDTGAANLLLEVRAPGGVNSPQARAVGASLVDAVAQAPYASHVTSYWTAPHNQAAGLVNRDGTSALVVARVAGDDGTAPKRVGDITAPLVGTRDGVTR